MLNQRKLVIICRQFSDFDLFQMKKNKKKQTFSETKLLIIIIKTSVISRDKEY